MPVYPVRRARRTRGREGGGAILIYEVDNRYPEVAPIYEKIRGGKHYGRLGCAAQRSTRINSLKRGFWTVAAAAVLLILLVVPLLSGGMPPEASPPPAVSTEPPTEPPTEPVTEPVIVPETESEATEPPATETEPPETEPPETEPPETEPPETEPPETEPFLGPTLTIVETDLDPSDAASLRYRYEVVMNSAQNLKVTAAVTATDGSLLGGDGPYSHTSSKTASGYCALSWSVRPETVTLTLTGEYQEDGVTKTVTDSRTLTVPEPPFIAPTLTITAASLDSSDISPLRCSYEVTLNSAESMSVTAVVTSNTGASLGSAGPYSRTVSGAAWLPVNLTWSSWPTSVTVTLTGTYTEKGVVKTLTAARTLAMPQQPFTAPTLSISAAVLDSVEITLLTLRYQLTLNSASSMRVSAVVTDNTGSVLGTAAADTLSSSGVYGRAIPLNLPVSYRPSTLTVKLTGEYSERGVTKTVTSTTTVSVPASNFVEPAIAITYTYIDDLDASPLTCSYTVTLNSAGSVSVTAVMQDDRGNVLGSAGPFVHTESGPYRCIFDLVYTMGYWPSTGRLILTATYTQNGVTKTVTAVKSMEIPF